MKIYRKYLICIVIIIMFLSGYAVDVFAGSKTFPAGSFVIPLEPCWQPNNDPAVGAVPAYCDTDKVDQGVFQAYGMVYDLLRLGMPVYWVIMPGKTDPNDIDMSIVKTDIAPIATVHHSTALSDTGSLAQIDYIGGPFVVDINDITPDIETQARQILGIAGSGNIYTLSKIHEINYDFTAEVDKILSGVPPKVAVLGEGATQVLLDYLMASGLGNRVFDIFQQVSTPDIIGGILDDFQLMWAPHWIIQDEVANPADRETVIDKIRYFLETGNSGFYECASIESLEGSYDVGKNQEVPGVLGTGFLIDEAETPPRIETNGIPKDFPYSQIVFEDPDNFLVQCAGFEYRTTGGHVHNYRPNQGSAFGGILPEPDYTYNSSVTRFVHADDDELITGYPPAGYDFYVGGRINGAATQGYVSYLAGHRYIECTDKNSPTPFQRSLRIEFNQNLSSAAVITVEVVHANCIPGSTCPKADFNMSSQTGGFDSDDWAAVDFDSAVFIYNPLIPSYYLDDVKIVNRSSSATSIIDVVITFGSSPPTVPAPLLTKVSDTTTATAVTLCTPNSPSPVNCLGGGVISNAKTLNNTFDTPLIIGTTIYFEAVHAGCSVNSQPSVGDGTCPVGTYQVGTGVTNSAQDATVKIDMSSASYDAVSNKLIGIIADNLTGGQITIDMFNVEFAGNGLAQLALVEDVTNPPAVTLCTPNMTSVANCPPVGGPPPPGPVVMKELEFEFKKIDDGPDPDITIEAVHADCTEGSTCPVATYNAPPGQSGTIANDGIIEIDLSAANLNSSKKLQNVRIRNISGVDRIVTRFNIDFPSQYWDSKKSQWKDNEFKKIKNITDGDELWKGKLKNPPVTVDLTTVLDLSISGGGGGGGVPGSLNFVIDPNGSVGSTTIDLGPLVTDCTINWSKSNTCGIRYVLNTLLGLQFQVIPNEYSKTQPIVKDDIVYKSTFEYPGYKGHLYAIDAVSKPAVELFDLGSSSSMPAAGQYNLGDPTSTNPWRWIFTNIPGTTTKQSFQPLAADLLTLKPLLYVPDSATISDNEARALIYAIRGRAETSELDPYGTRDISKKLGGIEHSTPAVIARSPNIRDVDDNILDRDRIVFAGGHDGMLHAFYVASWDAINAEYVPGAGREIWAYIPSSLLSSLRNQTFTDCNPEDDPLDECSTFPIAVSVDSSPAVGDYFVDIDGDGDKEFRTILMATAMIRNPGDTVQEVNQGIGFALDVTDVYNPQVLWERTYAGTITPPELDGITRNYYPSASFSGAYKTGEASIFDINMGTSKGSAIGRVQIGVDLKTYIFLTSKWVNRVPNSAGVDVWGLSAYALDFKTGDIKWSTKLIYEGTAAGVNETPPMPALMDIDNNGTDDYVIFGDMQGRLWALRTNDGTNITNSTPAYVVTDASDTPTEALEPIGASVSIYREAVVFGTGGRDSLVGESTYNYRIFAIGITFTGGIELWPDPFVLNPGEKVWAAPLIDPDGDIYIATATGYTELGRPDLVRDASSGRLLRMNIDTQPEEGVNVDVVDVGGAVVGGIDIENRHAYVTTFGGEIFQIGPEDDFSPSSLLINPFKTLWWRKL